MILANILTPVENLLRSVLYWLHGTVGFSWAWSIVALTVLVRIVLVPLTVKQIHSMQRLQAHAPEMKEIQRRYKQDKQRQQQELMRFYKENSINPLASCLPMVAQIPVFISLYLVLKHLSAAARKGQITHLGWLHIVPSIADKATAHWSGYILLGIYVLSQVASTYFMSASADPKQRMLMMIMPFFIVFFFIHFPSGLVLYWVTSNLWTVGQGLVIKRMVPRPPPPEKRTSRTPPAQEKTVTREPSKPAAPRRVKRKKGSGRR